MMPALRHRSSQAPLPAARWPLAREKSFPAGGVSRDSGIPGVKAFATGILAVPSLWDSLGFWDSGQSALAPADVLLQEGIGQRHEVRALAIVLAVAVTAGRRLVEVRLAVPHRLQLGGHLAGMAGMHPVVAPRGGEQGRRIEPARLGRVIGRIGLEPGPFLRLVWIAVLGDPARAGQQLAVAAHVDQRDRAEQRAEA